MEEDEYEIGWLSVENDFNARLVKKELLKYALQVVGRNPSDRAIERYWAQAGGSLSFEQFKLVMKREKKTSIANLMQAFKKIDSNGDGFITAKELQKKLTKRGEKMSADEVQAVIAEADLNGDGKLDYAEFCLMLNKSSEECIQANRQKMSRPSRSKSHVTQRNSVDRRERRREEIRMHLYSPEGKSPTMGVNEGIVVTPSSDAAQTQPGPQSAEASTTTVCEDGGTEERDGNGASENDVPMESLRPEQETDAVRQTDHLDNGDTTHGNGEESHAQGPSDDASAHGDGRHTTPDEPQESHSNGENTAPDEPQESRSNGENTAPDEPQESRSNGENTAPDEPQESRSNGENTAPDEPQESRSNGENTAPDEPQESRSNGENTALDEPQESPVPSDVTGVQESHENGGKSRVQESHSNGGVNGVQGSHGKDIGTEPSDVTRVQELETDARREDPISSDKGAEVKETVGKEREPNRDSGQPPQEVAPCSVVTSPPKKPSNIESWNSITGKGCFYLDTEDTVEEEREIRSHRYYLKLPAPTNVWVEMGVVTPGVQETDVLLFVFRIDKNEEITDIITYTQHKVNDRWICRMDLGCGTYALVPFTSGCHLKAVEEDCSIEARADVALTTSKDGTVEVSTEGCKALKEIFHRVDLDSNGYLSRTEFDFFQEVTSGELCDDASWNIILTNFDVTDEEEITLKGFLALHEMAASDEEGGEEELWLVVGGLGYDKQLQLTQACPFKFEVFTEDCEGEIEIVDMLPFSAVTDAPLSQLVMERGVVGAVKGGDEDEVVTHTFTTPYLTTIAVENKSSKTVYVQLDCSHSINCITNRESTVHVIEVAAHSSSIGYHIQQAIATEPYTICCIASKILN